MYKGDTHVQMNLFAIGNEIVIKVHFHFLYMRETSPAVMQIQMQYLVDVWSFFAIHLKKTTSLAEDTKVEKKENHALKNTP